NNCIDLRQQPPPLPHTLLSHANSKFHRGGRLCSVEEVSRESRSLRRSGVEQNRSRTRCRRIRTASTQSSGSWRKISRRSGGPSPRQDQSKMLGSSIGGGVRFPGGVCAKTLCRVRTERGR